MRVETIRRGGYDTWVLGLVGIQSEHYWLEVNAMTKPMVVLEKHSPYGEEPT